MIWGKLDNFQYKDKRQALEALQVKVFVEQDGFSMHGVMPVAIGASLAKEACREATLRKGKL